MDCNIIFLKKCLNKSFSIKDVCIALNVNYFDLLQFIIHSQLVVTV